MIEIKSIGGAVLHTVDADSLVGANLRGAGLRGADLRGADLRGAGLRGATLPTGETWELYLGELVPALCQAGGRPLAEVATEEHWTCHEWGNCPMSAAFGLAGPENTPPGLENTPLLHRPRIEQFVQLFDAGLIPRPEIPSA